MNLTDSTRPPSRGLFFGRDDNEDAGKHPQSQRVPYTKEAHTARVEKPGGFSPFEDAEECSSDGSALDEKDRDRAMKSRTSTRGRRGESSKSKL